MLNISPLHNYSLKQSGLSLIELMISIAIGLLLLAALSTLFVNQSRTRTELDKQNRMIDNGRYALDLISENLRMAGFYGELDPSSITLPAALPDPCVSNIVEPPIAPANSVLRLHIQGYDAATPTTAITDTPTCVPSSIKAGTDILVVRRAHTTSIAPASIAANTTYLQVSLCIPKTGLNENAYILRKAPATFNLSQKTCTIANSGPQANLRRFLVQLYFIDSNNEAGDGIPTLKMAELDTTSNFVVTPLVEGIEFMQVDYGIDTNDDGAPDGAYSSCSACTVEDWANVVSVKVNIVSRNLETTTGYTDGNTYNLGTAGNITPGGNYKRHAYTEVIRLNNPASRKE